MEKKCVFYFFGLFSAVSLVLLACESLPPAGENTEVQISDTATFTLVDAAGDGVFEALIADVDVEILSPGFYTVMGTLRKNGKRVSNLPSDSHTQRLYVEIGDQPGTHTARLIFSGEEILRSGEDGPYELFVSVNDQTIAKKTILTPAYDHTRFGEYGAVLTGVRLSPDNKIPKSYI